jgi:hypothetical protein
MTVCGATTFPLKVVRGTNYLLEDKEDKKNPPDGWTFFLVDRNFKIMLRGNMRTEVMSQGNLQRHTELSL